MKNMKWRNSFVNLWSIEFLIVAGILSVMIVFSAFSTSTANLLSLGFILAVLAGSADLLGGYLSIVKKTISQKQLIYFISIGAGFILGVVMFERIPAVISSHLPQGMIFVVGGFITLLIIENFFASHAHNNNPMYNPHGSHTLMGSLRGDESLISNHASFAALTGLLIHTFLDGAAIVAGFLISFKVGVILFLAVMLHKIPEGLSMGSIMLASGKSRIVALQSAAALGIATIAGGAIPSIVHHHATTHTYASTPIIEAFLALATGTFLYIATVNLIPTTNESRDKRAVIMIALGIMLFVISTQLFGLLGLE